MLYTLIILAIIIILILVLRLRIRLNIDDKQKIAFAGLGRTGPEYDFKTKLVTIKLAGMKLKTISAERKEKEPKKRKAKKEVKEKPKKVRPIKKILENIPLVSKALWRYTVSLLKATIVEELNGKITAGFDSPDVTGQVFGYYQALAGAVPAIGNRLEYIPVWDETTVSGSVRASVALPLYKIVFRTIILIFSLPLREIIKLTIGYKERSHDGQ